MSWFVTLTIRWSDLEVAGSRGPRDFLDWCGKQPIRWNQMPMSPDFWHSTVYAIARFDSPGSHGAMHNAAREVLDRLRKTDLSKVVKKSAPFSIEANQIRCYQNVTSVQFADSPEVAEIRERVTGFLDTVPRPWHANHWRFPYWDDAKNFGDRLWGSIGRSAAPVDRANDRLQSVTPIPNTVQRKFDVTKLLLTVSDEALSNPLVAGVDYDEITLTP